MAIIDRVPSWLRSRLPGDGPAGARWQRLGALTLTSLGVVYGDIGTSPLYAVREVFYGRHHLAPTPTNVLGVLSLVVWSLLLVISLKYLAFVLHASYGGEGGILALMELATRKVKGRWQGALLVVGLFGAALLYGDGMITPAISVLSAIEGLEVATPALRTFVIPITIAILIGLFVLQRVGTGRVGRRFGPVMLLWFLLLGLSGTVAIVRDPAVLAAFNPAYGLRFLSSHGWGGMAILAIVFLVVTGGEALYADIGHFGTLPIRVGWYAMVLPALLLNYLGQGATILARGAGLHNPFYQMMPGWALYPMVVLATAATVIASQAIISGAFSLTFQAFQLGYLPRLRIFHTSERQRGQIYIPVVNWILLAATIGLVLGFRSSGALAGAYGMAIATTMVITTVLYAVAMRTVFAWAWPVALAVTAVFLALDLTYFAANLTKFAEGGWFPVAVAVLVYLVMATWQRGVAVAQRQSRGSHQDIRTFLAEIGGGGTYRRVPGQAVYLTSDPQGIPATLRNNLIHNRALHDLVIIFSFVFVKAPRVPEEEHLRVEHLRDDIIRVHSRCGFMETLDIPRDLERVRRETGITLDLDRLTYFIAGQLLLTGAGRTLPPWRASLYAIMARNGRRAIRDFNLPPRQLVEIGVPVRV